MSDPHLCQYCQAPATVHLTQIMDAKVIKVHLCESCAAKGAVAESPVFKLAEMLSGKPDDAPGEPAGPVCPDCGLSEATFRKTSRLGCATCYTVFSETIAALLPGIQPALTHRGKHPAGARVHALRAELDRSRAELQAAVKAERYEDAARLRDRILELDTEIRAAGSHAADA